MQLMHFSSWAEKGKTTHLADIKGGCAYELEFLSWSTPNCSPGTETTRINHRCWEDAKTRVMARFVSESIGRLRLLRDGLHSTVSLNSVNLKSVNFLWIEMGWFLMFHVLWNASNCSNAYVAFHYPYGRGIFLPPIGLKVLSKRRQHLTSQIRTNATLIWQ